MRFKHVIHSVVFSCLFLFVSVATLTAGEIGPQLQAVLEDAAPGDYIPVIIELSNKFDKNAFKGRNRSMRKAQRRLKLIRKIKAHAKATQADLLTNLRNQQGRNTKSLWINNSIATELKARFIRRIARRPGIQQIKLDRVVPLAEGQGDGSSPPEWNLNAIHTFDLWNLGYNGQGVVVALMDTGADLDHPDLSTSYRGGANSWYDPNGEYSAPFDNDGHGTGVLSVILGANTSGDNIGVAPGAQWIAVKIFNSQGMASYSVIHAGFQWLLDPDGDPNTDDAPHIVNNSWGFDQQAGTCDPEFSNDIDVLKTAEIAVVFSAGNSGPLGNTSVAPANDPLAFSAGSVDVNLSIDSQSARGPSACNGDFYPHTVAPGVDVKAADLTLGGLFPDSYRQLTGTSIATSHVSGAMALLLSAFPDTNVIDLEEAITQTASDLGPVGPDDDYGHGMLNTLAAYNWIDVTQPAVCTDSDGDGFFAEANCGALLDCNDADPGSYPGATEIKIDGIDQDCNGYDLTIDIWKAVYYADQDKLSLRANSDLAAAADLSAQIPGIGTKTMDWNVNKQWWQRTINNAISKGFDPANPGTVMVTGVEGFDSIAITVEGVCTDADGDGFFAEANCGTPLDCNDTDPGSYPGAAEIQMDGIDQDCNGYDLTIDIWRADYYAGQDKLSIRVNSELAASADLSADIPGIGVRGLGWNANKQWWQRTINNASSKGFDPANPGVVIVFGTEGETSRPITLK